MTLFDAIAFFIVIALLIGVGIFQSRRVRTESSYLFAGRKTKWAALTATLVMTEFNSATLISFASLGYAAGLWALTLPFIFLFGLLFYAASVAKKWKAFDGFSVAGFFTQRYGRDVGSCASILLLIAMLGFSAAYIKSLTLLFLPLSPSLNPWVLSLALCLLVLVMTLRGGLLAIIRTDVLSLIFMLLFFPLTALFLWKSSSLPPLSFPGHFFRRGNPSFALCLLPYGAYDVHLHPGPVVWTKDLCGRKRQGRLPLRDRRGLPHLPPLRFGHCSDGLFPLPRF